MNDIVGGLSVFEDTEASFDRYLNERALYHAWQVALVLTQAINMDDFYWITKPYAKRV